jgi:hypothetical protein
MTHRKTQSWMTKMLAGLAVGTTLMGPAAARAEMDADCYGAVVSLYMAERASGSLDYLVCKATCREGAPEDRSVCRLGCRLERAAAARAAHEDVDALQVLCDGGDVAAAQLSSPPPSPSICVPDLSDCAANARASARACDRRSGDLATFSDCAAGVGAAVDQCAADFVDCALPAEEPAAE